jgi:phosphoribosylaminoimidazolecarboxamide formyltransferase/IMP cyclohydrolase
VLAEAGVPTIDISMISRNPEAFGGRMKTISFNVESAILYDRERDEKEADLLGIHPIDMVVCNLYPFGEVMKRTTTMDELVENIDIGGPTMIRAAAKNWKYVAAVTNPDQYERVVEDLEDYEGEVTEELRRELMTAAFNLTADYDSMIAQKFDPNTVRLAFDGRIPLRYGENSHQNAEMYRQRGSDLNLYDMRVLQGKAISFNNVLDINAAVEAIREMKNSACSVVKHTNPCGLCEGKNDRSHYNDQRKILEYAWAGDPVSAFGSIVAFNRRVSSETVEFFELESKKAKFIEVIVAPEYTPEALEYLKKKKNLRVVALDFSWIAPRTEYRYMNGLLLKQSPDNQDMSAEPNEISDLYPVDIRLICFGLTALKTIKSNAIIIIRQIDGGHKQILGMGAGQPNRLIATQIAIDKAKANLKFGEDLSDDCWLISDAFFPFPDCVEMAAKAGIKNVAQPGGSIRDNLVKQKAEELGVKMILTGLRHFKH